MAAEDQTPCTKLRPGKAKTRKKTKRDKWGQPISAAAADEEPSVEPEQEHPAGVVEAAVQVEKEEEEEATAAAEGYEPGKVVASGLPYTTTEADIRKLFEFYGPIQSMQLSRFPDSGNFRGLAFLCFESEEDAIKSLELDGFKIGSRYMRVERCRVTATSNKKRKAEFETDPKKSEGCLSAYVGNLSWNVDENDLRGFFGPSKIASVRFAVDKRTGGSRGFCHVEFQDDESLEKAIAMNQSKLQGRPVKVAYSVSNRG
ncbi:phragmoplastin interacting protein 1 [Zea mays]|uniref:Phragmoplastin interacting protein 1 n=1 Tax=Zea mays TaxID=4577 RepID=B4FKK3_MAIZE|nr:unknown [Zea mays]ONL93135.1 phragmoplastin interacting protein 1 [Zea mays]